jgi:hypothetical protein
MCVCLCADVGFMIVGGWWMVRERRGGKHWVGLGGVAVCGMNEWMACAGLDKIR